MAPGTERNAIMWHARPRYGSNLQPVRSDTGNRVNRGDVKSTSQPALDALPEERPLSIEINGHPVATLLGTPDAPAELGAGWAFGHGYFDDPKQLLQVKGYADRVSLMLEGQVTRGREWPTLVTAGFDSALSLCPRDANQEPVRRDPGSNVREDLWRIERTAFQAIVQTALAKDGIGDSGIHQAALADAERVRAMAQDISRHNAVDKVIGWSLLQRLPRERLLLLVSGRISADIVFKAWRAGLLLIASPGLPTRQAVALAEQRRITLVGQTLAPTRTVYTHPWRLIEAVKPAQPDTEAPKAEVRAAIPGDYQPTR